MKMPALFTVIPALVALLATNPALADLQSAVNAVRQLNGVLGAVPDNGGNLWVSVVPNPGTPWNQVAANICQVIKGQRSLIFLVKIVDYTSVRTSKKPGDWRKLGGANCAAN